MMWFRHMHYKYDWLKVSGRRQSLYNSRSRGLKPLNELHKVCLKSRWKKKKCMTGPAALNLQPSDLRSNAYRSLPGGQDVFFLLFSSISIHRNLVSNSLPHYLLFQFPWARNLSLKNWKYNNYHRVQSEDILTCTLSE